MIKGVNPIGQISNLNPIEKIQKITPDIGSKKIDGVVAPDFASVLTKAIGEVNTQKKVSEAMINDFAAGKISNIHDVIVTAEKASMSLKLSMEVRNSIVDAYREIMRMQL